MTSSKGQESASISLAATASERHISPMASASLNRIIFRLSGEGVQDWLSGLITNEINGDATFAALLTPQGKIIADFFIYKEGDALLLDTPSKFAADLHKRLRMYRLRAPIEIEETDLTVKAVWDNDNAEGFMDPRHPTLGNRVIGPASSASGGDYNAHRLSLGVADSEWDFDSAKVFPADANMELMNGVDFKKGCFVGQEVVSRMKRRQSGRPHFSGRARNRRCVERARQNWNGNDTPRPPTRRRNIADTERRKRSGYEGRRWIGSLNSYGSPRNNPQKRPVRPAPLCGAECGMD